MGHSTVALILRPRWVLRPSAKGVSVVRRVGAEVEQRKIVQALRETYCGSIGAEFMHMSDPAEKRWWQERLESSRGRETFSAEQKKQILDRLTAAEGLERYLHTKYVGQKRFSLEGGESFIASMDEVVQRAGRSGVQEIVIGMAHRGRLNVLVNTLGKMPADLFAEFEGKHVDDLPAGDVKYHKGFSSDVSTEGGPVHLSLAFNPSHLEIVNPVVEGSVLRAGERVRITAQLIHAPTDKHLWAESYDRDLRDVLSLQSEVARAIAEEIKVTLTPQEQAVTAAARPINPEAYQAYVKGRYFWNKRTPDGLTKATDYFEEAVRLAPEWSLAYVGLADAYLGRSRFASMPPGEAAVKARAAATRRPSHSRADSTVATRRVIDPT